MGHAALKKKKENPAKQSYSRQRLYGSAEKLLEQHSKSCESGPQSMQN
jgi:hypothetical protein